MSKRVKVAIAVAAASAAVGAALSMPACEGVPLTAAPGTQITMSANPESVPANGGVSVVTAILVEPAGTFAPDGTEVFFFTNLGRVDASGKSVNGVVRVNFVSDARCGTAVVTGVSGGAAPSSPTTTTTTLAGAARPGVSASSTGGSPVFGASDVTADANTSSVSITVCPVDHLLVTANPQVLTQSRSATIVASVFDSFGNPVQNVPVIFQITATAPATAPMQEVLDSGGSPRYTDSNGQAFDTLTTKAPVPTLTATQKTVTVTATTANGKSNFTTVAINYGTGR